MTQFSEGAIKYDLIANISRSFPDLSNSGIKSVLIRELLTIFSIAKMKKQNIIKSKWKLSVFLFKYLSIYEYFL